MTAALIKRARSLLWVRQDVLADFEIALINEVYSRVLANPASIRAVTAGEWCVIEDATEAMLAAPRQDLTAMGQAA